MTQKKEGGKTMSFKLNAQALDDLSTLQLYCGYDTMTQAVEVALRELVERHEAQVMNENSEAQQ